jgi:excisionase family DNA binding protein
MTQATKRPAAQVACAQKAAELKTSKVARSRNDSWSRFSDAPTPRLTVTVKEAARLSGLSRTTVWKHISSGLLRSTSVGRSRLVHFASLEALVFAREEAQPPQRVYGPIRKNGSQTRRRGLPQ